MRALKLIDGTLALTLLTSGLALRNCVFVSAAALFSVSVFYRDMDSRQPGHPLQVALRCIGTGVGLIATAIVLGVILVTGAFGFWPSVNLLALAAGTALAIVVFTVLATRSPDRSAPFLSFEVTVAGSATLALGLAANGAGWIACLYAGAALAIVGALGWHLARETATAVLRSGMER